MAEAVYIIGTLISMLCAGLLWRSYRQSRSRLLFWSTLCFLGLAVNNVELLVDLYLLPNMDLSLLRSGTALAAVLAMLFGLLWETR